MAKASPGRLAALVDDVHFPAHLPKHLIMSAGLATSAAGSGLAGTSRGRDDL